MFEMQKYETKQEDSIVYGNKNLIDDSIRGYQYIGANMLVPRKLQLLCRGTTTVNQEERDIIVTDWPEKKDTFTQEDSLDSEEHEVNAIIFRFRASHSIPYREKLAKGLFTLLKDAKEEDPVCLGISAASLRSFYNFLQLHTNLKYPIVSLTPDYNIYASWRSEQNRVFSVHFLPNGDVRFVIFKPSDKHPERQIRSSGIATADTLMEEALPKGVSDWVLNER